MKGDACADISKRIGAKLADLGLAEVGCRQFGQHLTGHGAMYADEVAYYQDRGRLIAISWSIGNGHGCWIGRQGDDPATYEQWPTLWSVLGLDAGLDFNDDNPAIGDVLDTYLDQFPEGYYEFIDFIGLKLAELISVDVRPHHDEA